MTKHMVGKIIAAVLAGAVAGLSCAAHASAASAARPLGQLVNVAGSVAIQRGKQPAIKGALLTSLQNGDVVKVGDGGSAEVVLFATGARFALAAKSAARIDSSGLKPLSGPAPRQVGA